MYWNKWKRIEMFGYLIRMEEIMTGRANFEMKQSDNR